MAVSSAHAWFSPFQYRFIDTRQNSSKNKVWRDWKSRTDQVVNRPPRRANRVLIERTCLQSGMRQRDSVYSENALNSTRNLCWKKRKKLDRTESNDSKTNRGCYKFRGNPFHVQLTVFPRSFFLKTCLLYFFLSVLRVETRTSHWTCFVDRSEVGVDVAHPHCRQPHNKPKQKEPDDGLSQCVVSNDIKPAPCLRV